MDLECILSVFGAICLVYFLVCLVLVIFGDCDIVLQFRCKFGKPIACLKGKVVWITGASSGIGEYIAYELAKVGAKLVLSARREEELERVKKKCLTYGACTPEDIMVLKLDVLEFPSHQQAVDTVMKYFKKIDVLVNNAGRSQRAEWLSTSLKVDQEILELNVLGVLSLTKTVLPHMVERKNGHIVIMSSVAGKLGAPVSGSYTGSKHALQGWFNSLRIEASPLNIRVTSICPGPVFSNILETAFTEKEGEELKGQMNPTEKRMSTERCAYLSAVAIANQMYEVWLTRNPVLIFLYLSQYFPNFAFWAGNSLGAKNIRKLRDARF